VGVVKCTNFIPLKSRCNVYNTFYESRNSSVIFNGRSNEEFLYT